MVHLWVWKANERWQDAEDLDWLFDYNDGTDRRTMAARSQCRFAASALHLWARGIENGEDPWEDLEKCYMKILEQRCAGSLTTALAAKRSRVLLRSRLRSSVCPKDDAKGYQA